MGIGTNSEWIKVTNNNNNYNRNNNYESIW